MAEKRSFLARLEEAQVQDVVKTKGRQIALIRLEQDKSIHTVDSSPESFISAIVPNGKTAKKGERCLVISKDPEFKTNVYYFDSIDDQFFRDSNTFPANNLSDDSKQLKSNNAQMFVTDNASGFVTEGNALKIEKQQFSISNGGYKVFGSQELIRLSILNNNSSLSLENNSASLISKGNLTLIGKEGKVSVGGSSGMMIFDSELKVISGGFVQNADTMTLSSGIIKIKAASGLPFGLTPFDATFDLQVVQGSMDISVGSGDVNFTLLDPTLTSSFKVDVGPSLAFASVEVNGSTGIELDYKPASVSTSSLKLASKATLKSLTEVDISSPLKVDISSMAIVSISAIAKGTFDGGLLAEIKGTLIKFGAGTGPVVTSITSPVIDLITNSPQMGVPTILAG